MQPGIILLDEPSANLDYKAADDLRKLIQAWKSAGKTILIAEHRINYVWDLCDRVVILQDGAVAEDLNAQQKEALTNRQLNEWHLRSRARVSPQELVAVRLTDLRENSETESIELRGFSYQYTKDRKLFALDDMHIQTNAVTALVGNNGAGKTTFLECLCGIRKCPGILRYKDKEYRAKERRGLVFMVMQDPNHQLFTESVLDEVLISQPEQDKEAARGILEKLDLLPFAERHPMSLSGGQKQRVAIACAVASECPILLFDEPTSGLDYDSMRKVSAIMKQLKDTGHTIITVTHDTEFIETCCDYALSFGGPAYDR